MNQRISFQLDRPQSYISQQLARIAKRLPVWSLEFKTLLSLYRLWAKRISDRRQLANMDEHLLKDIGISRFDALSEANKPFWKE